MSIRQRRNYSLVDRPRQYKFLGLITAYNLVIVLFFGVSLFIPDFLSIQDETLPFENKLAVAERILYLHSRIWPAVIALICLIGLHSFRVIHRFIGPLFRFRWAFDQLGQGNLGCRIRLRTKDYLHREEESFNAMMETLAPRLENFRAECENALRSMDEILERGAEIPAPLRESLGRTRTHLHAALESAAYFHIHTEPDPFEETRIADEEITNGQARPQVSGAI
jgi:methyl-accepting chemotaxis protein